MKRFVGCLLLAGAVLSASNATAYTPEYDWWSYSNGGISIGGETSLEVLLDEQCNPIVYIANNLTSGSVEQAENVSDIEEITIKYVAIGDETVKMVHGFDDVLSKQYLKTETEEGNTFILTLFQDSRTEVDVGSRKVSAKGFSSALKSLVNSCAIQEIDKKNAI
jgi:hypothetical protein